MEEFNPAIPCLLPAESMYLIQVGSRLFKVSGASLSSDGPSYFTEKFTREPQENGEVLFIDRSAETFELIYAHLQGYAVNVRDEVQFTMLVSDAMYYNLPRLRKALREYDYLFANVSGRTFKIPRSLFRRPGDEFNYFTLTADRAYADLETVFIDQQLLRPPPQQPLYVPRSAELLEALLLWLGGASTELDECRRGSLVAEARYYRLLNLEQRLLKAKIAYNPLTGDEFITMRLRDLRQGRFEFPFVTLQHGACCEDSMAEGTPSNGDSSPQLKRLKPNSCPEKPAPKWKFASYKRPHLDEKARELVFQIDRADCTLVFNRRSKIIHLLMTSASALLFQTLFEKPLHEVGIEAKRYLVKGTEGDPQYALPACVSLAEFTVNGMKCPNITRMVADGNCEERVIDFTNMDKVSCCTGMQLHLTQSLWKLGVDDRGLILVALKATAVAGTKEYCRTLDYV